MLLASIDTDNVACSPSLVAGFDRQQRELMTRPVKAGREDRAAAGGHSAGSSEDLGKFKGGGGGSYCYLNKFYNNAGNALR